MNKVLLIVMLMLGGIIMEKTIVTGDPRVDWKIRRGVPIEYVKKVPDTVRVGETLAQEVVPSSYFLDLRASNLTTTTRRYTADWMTLHDKSDPQRTVSVADVDVTNDITIAGPIAGGRDQSGVLFTAPAPGFICFFIIYNPATQTISSLSSQSTTPTLPMGYDYYSYVGCAYGSSAGGMAQNYQFGNTIHTRVAPLLDGAPSVAGTYQALDLSNYVPATARKIFGQFGLSSDPGGIGSRGMAISCASTGSSDIMVAASFANLPPVSGYPPYGGTWFILPIRTAQTIWWTASSTAAAYYIAILGWEDDL